MLVLGMGFGVSCRCWSSLFRTVCRTANWAGDLRCHVGYAMRTWRRWFAGLRKEYARRVSSLAIRFKPSDLAFVTPVSTAGQLALPTGYGAGHDDQLGDVRRAAPVSGSGSRRRPREEQRRGRHAMAEQEPVTELCAFSSPGAVPTEWAQARGDLRDTEVYWLSTVRPGWAPPRDHAAGSLAGRRVVLLYRSGPSRPDGHPAGLPPPSPHARRCQSPGLRCQRAGMRATIWPGHAEVVTDPRTAISVNGAQAWLHDACPTHWVVTGSS